MYSPFRPLAESSRAFIAYPAKRPRSLQAVRTMPNHTGPIYRATVQVTSTTFLPVLTQADDDPYGDPAAPVLDEFLGELAVAYSFGPPYGERLVSWLDLDRL